MGWLLQLASVGGEGLSGFWRDQSDLKALRANRSHMHGPGFHGHCFAAVLRTAVFRQDWNPNWRGAPNSTGGDQLTLFCIERLVLKYPERKWIQYEFRFGLTFIRGKTEGREETPSSAGNERPFQSKTLYWKYKTTWNKTSKPICVEMPTWGSMSWNGASEEDTWNKEKPVSAPTDCFLVC